MSPDYDVAIVGYGPVGQALATRLGRAGWRVGVFDKQPGLYPLPRACHLDHEAMRIMQSLGIADEVAAAMVPAREYLLLRADLSTLSDLPRNWETPSGWESSYHFYQPDIEGLFDAAAKSTPGVSVHQATEVRAVRDLGDRVAFEAVDGEETRQLSARLLVGADGANSLVRETLGIGREDLGFQATWVVVDVELREGAEPLDVPDTGQVLDPAQPRHMAWLGGRYYRWEFMLPGDPDEAEAQRAARPENVWPKLGQWVDPDSARLLRSTAYTFRSLIAETFHQGRVLLAGDAAHLMPPFMGQGMVSGLRDVATASWVIDLVLRGAPLDVLAAYTACRRPHVRSYIEESVRVGRLVCETDPVKARERDRILAAETEPTPPFQPPTGDFFLPGPLTGSLAVQPRVGTQQKLLDDLLGPRWILLTSDLADLGPLPDIGIALTEVLVAEGSEYASSEDRLERWLTAAGVSWVVVRPDGYVFASGNGAAAAAAAVGRLGALIGLKAMLRA